MSIVFFLITLFVGHQFLQSRTYRDIQNVLAGNIDEELDIDLDELSDGTFTFRMAHLFERCQYLNERPEAMILGAGLIPEDSKKVDDLFDFRVGLLEELTDTSVQLDTGDISYSLLFIRLGYVGTFIYLLIYFYFFYFFFKNRKNVYSRISIMFLILTFGVSFFSANLVNPINYVLFLITYCIVKKENESLQESENKQLSM